MSHEPSFDDTQDFADASRGFLGKLTPGVIRTAAGKLAWVIDEYDFLQSDCPPTANPKLWRQGQLNSKQGLYEITHGIYQIRAFDISNMTIIEGKEGIIVVDPLISNECAAAALELYQKHRDPEKRRPVTGVIYSHSHVDHYMGARGILPSSHDTNPVPIIAPEGFMEAVLSEFVVAGPAMRARAIFMYGMLLPKGPTGQIGVGLGMGTSTGTRSIIPPNQLVSKTGDELVIDGVRIAFQMVQDTEAPSEFNFYFSDFKALYISECASNCMHNIVTLRGAQVRDAKAWSQGLDESMILFGNDAEVLLGGHNWPAWGRDRILKRITEQRDMYAYLHDQTVRLMNLGLTGIEIAEKIQLPPRISSAWHCQGYYGSVSHNVKGIYQKYMTWFDGNPAHLWPHTPIEEGKRYVAVLGGVDALCKKAQDYVTQEDFRFAATLLHHAVAAYPELTEPKQMLAGVYDQLGFGAENATWRNFYLTGASELRTGKKVGRAVLGKADLYPNLTTGQWFEVLSVQIDGELAAEKKLVVDFDVSDVKENWRVVVSNGVLIYRRKTGSSGDSIEGQADLKLTLRKGQLLETLKGKSGAFEKAEGRIEALEELWELLSIKTGATHRASQL